MHHSLEYRNPADLLPDPENARTHNRKQRRKLKRAFARNGRVMTPLVINEQNKIIAGHARLDLALVENLDQVPVMVVSGLTAAQERGLAIADNRIAEDGAWDEAQLRRQLEAILTIEPTYDLTVTGLETPEIDGLLEIEVGTGEDPQEDHCPPVSDDTVAQQGDLFLLNGHRLLCADATVEESYEVLTAGEQVQLLATDLPYNLEIARLIGKGRHQHREFPTASGELSRSEFERFLTIVFSHVSSVCADGALAFTFMDWRHLSEILAAGDAAFADLVNLCVWVKSNGGMGSLYRSQHELILVFKVKKGAHINNVELGRHGRNRTNVWHHPGANAFGKTRDADLASHPTRKPVALIEDLLRDCSDRGGIVLDPFAGSGTCLVAAEKAGRRAYTMELDPAYVDVAIRRWQAFTGGTATHEETGLTFDALAEKRQSAVDEVPDE